MSESTGRKTFSAEVIERRAAVGRYRAQTERAAYLTERGWTVTPPEGFEDPQRARKVAEFNRLKEELEA